MDFLEKLGVTNEEFTTIIDNNPSARGLLSGYIAEFQLVKLFFSDLKVFSPDDHNRTNKSDLIVQYKGEDFKIECKSLQTNSVKRIDGGFIGKAQCDASDKRTVRFLDGSLAKTTCLLRGDFDILAVSLFAFEYDWKFAFILNRDLPYPVKGNYTDIQRKMLIKTNITIKWPLCNSNFTNEPFSLFNKLLEPNNS